MRNASIDRQIAESTTGIRENPAGIGTFYDGQGNPLTQEEARDRFDAGYEVEVPNAGAGSYQKVFETLGYAEAKPVEWSSSAGDWIFAIANQGIWYLAYLSNRHPHYGFRYTRGVEVFPTYARACQFCNA